MLENFCCPPRTTIKWQILPFKPVLVRFDLNEEVWSRLSILLNTCSLSLEDIERSAADLVPLLDEVWKACSLHGAILISPWREEVADLFSLESSRNGIQKIIRPANPLLVLNVLCRSRAGLLLPHLPLSIEAPFLKRDFLSTDPRLIVLAEEEAAHD